nr:hypothetical protein [Leclercia sp.]
MNPGSCAGIFFLTVPLSGSIIILPSSMLTVTNMSVLNPASVSQVPFGRRLDRREYYVVMKVQAL